MAIGHGTIPATYGLSTAVGLALGVFVWYNREKRGAIPLSLCLFGTALYSGALFVAAAVDSVAISTLMVQTLFVGIVTSIAAIFLFALEYTGREHVVTRTTIAAVAIEPIIVVALAFFNPGGVFFESIVPAPESVTGIEIEWGFAAGLHILYSYVVMLAAAVLVLEFLYRSRSVYRGQAVALLSAMVIPTASNVLYVAGVFPFDPTPVGYLITGVLFTVAIFRYQLVDIVPIARDRILDNVSDGVFVIDREDRIIDTNPAGRAMLADIEGSAIGLDIDSIFVDLPDLRDLYHDLTTQPTETEREVALMGGCFHVRVTPIDDGRDTHVGWLFIVRDITDRKRHETQLERQNKRLERFADVVSHDLRNPLSVADGYVDLALETGDVSHLEKVQRSHDRMDAIIDDVLALAREGESVRKTEPVELGAVAREAWENVATGDDVLSIDGSAVVLADRARLLRLLENLFRNAVEHGSTSPPSHAREDSIEHGRPTNHTGSTEETTEANPQLTVSVGVLGGNSVYGFYVADDGRGLPDDEKIFEQGYTTNEDGTGFGLSIVEQIATAHNWTIDATESEDGGARFELAGVETAKASEPTVTS
ncbi:histidine kinase N-terminal 7TM domain-containing protein [Natrinema marinum]|uniref:histidine kinase N-terminal 7TM domain-containing protein n=1 Tax=Natrinema marinum TaxID=2961598 RepID=UPI0020C8DB2A|nr:histidine kinase N-terminal 7TM domain-containing protein [Natrinema marinum]